MSTVSPSTTFKTSAVVPTGSARTVGGELTAHAGIAAATLQTTNTRINVRTGPSMRGGSDIGGRTSSNDRQAASPGGQGMIGRGAGNGIVLVSAEVHHSSAASDASAAMRRRTAHLPVLAESGTAEFAPDGETARVAPEIP
jgi:hypothetical protein